MSFAKTFPSLLCGPVTSKACKRGGNTNERMVTPIDPSRDITCTSKCAIVRIEQINNELGTEKKLRGHVSKNN